MKDILINCDPKLDHSTSFLGQVSKYTGLGDLMALAWLSEGLKQHGYNFRFYATDNPKPRRTLLILLNQQLIHEDEADHGIVLDRAWKEFEFPDKGYLPRMYYVANYLRIPILLRRPIVLHDSRIDNNVRMIEEFSNNKPIILLFPSTTDLTRAWPQSCWLELAWRLNDAYFPVMVTDKEEQWTHHAPCYIYGKDINELCRIMTRSSLVIGNDSFPIHLAGTLNKQALALLGPTSQHSWSYLSTVSTLSNDKEGCQGCFYTPPYSKACTFGCRSLFHITVNDVVTSAKRLTLFAPPAEL